MTGKHTDCVCVSGSGAAVSRSSSSCRCVWCVCCACGALLGVRRNSTLASCSAPRFSSPRHSAALGALVVLYQELQVLPLCRGRCRGSLPFSQAIIVCFAPRTPNADRKESRSHPWTADSTTLEVTPDNDRTPRRSSGGRGTAHQTHKRPGNARAGNSRTCAPHCSCHITDR